jgi:tripartite-type tricarboxylate transporter receptor subunit TctC
MAESGFPELTNGSWQGVYVPKATPKFVVDRLFPVLTKTMHDPEVGRRLATASAVAITSESPADFYKFWKSENERWAKVVKDVGAVAQK